MFPTITLPASDLRKNLREVLDQLCADKTSLLVTRKGKEDVIIMPAEEFRGWQETLHLLKSPKNAKRLTTAIEEVKNGHFFEKSLLES